jgi:O-antigen ligase
MLKSLKVNHFYIYFVGLFLLIISLPLSRFALSVAQFTLVVNWLWEADFRRKLKLLKSNGPVLVLVMFYVIHVISLIYTSDFDFAMKDLRVKLPLLALPIIIATSKSLPRKKLDILLFSFIGAALMASFISFGILIFKDISDIREISPFISHIRMNLNLCLAILFAGFYTFSKDGYPKGIKIALALAMIWLIVFIVISRSGTGIYILSVTFFILVVYGLAKFSNQTLRLAIILLALILPVLMFLYLKSTINDYLIPHKNDLKNLEGHTQNGNPYFHDTINYRVENGSYIGIYVCDIELRKEWINRSTYDYDGLDDKGHELKHTLIRYLNSKGLRKDGNGMAQLKDQDIRNVEKGIANVHFTRKFSFNAGIFKMIWEYQTLQRGENPGGSSLIQRIEYWKASWGIIREHFWIGVGTGDLPAAFESQYERMNSPLAPEFRHRSHNQFLAVWIAFGIIGLIWFIISLIYPPIKLGTFFDFRYMVFFVVIFLSMLIEDTLETQMGVTLYAFFNALFLFGKEQHSTD